MNINKTNNSNFDNGCKDCIQGITNQQKKQIDSRFNTTTDPGVSVCGTVINTLKSSVGAGILSFPYGFYIAGWLGGTVAGATGSVVLWGVDKDAGVKGTEKYCSVAVNGEASASGGHWSSVTTLSISSDTVPKSCI